MSNKVDELRKLAKEAIELRKKIKEYTEELSHIKNQFIEKSKNIDFSFRIKIDEGSDKAIKNKKENIFIIKESKIEHLGFSSTSISKNKDFEYLRNWHWMWSKFYFNKKHFGFYEAIKKTYLNLFSAIFKFLIFIILFNSFKRKIYLYRILGLWNSMIGKKSWFRIDV